MVVSVPPKVGNVWRVIGRIGSLQSKEKCETIFYCSDHVIMGSAKRLGGQACWPLALYKYRQAVGYASCAVVKSC